MDQSAEDSLIQIYIDAALDYVSNYLNCANYPQTASIKAAVLLLIGDLYENREAGGQYDIKRNAAVDNLLYPYRERIGI